MFTSRLKSDGGFAIAAVLIGAGSLLVGGAAATAAVVTVVHNYGPGDAHAKEHGPTNILPSQEILQYGG